MREDTAMSAEPARRGRTTRRAGRDKRDVLQAAADVIGRRGAEATRFTDVAAASGVPVSTLQYYFGSREDMLVAAFRHASQTELAALAADLGQVPRAAGRLTRIVEGVLAGYRPEAGQGPLWIEAWRFALRDEEMREDVRQDNHSWRVLVQAAAQDTLAEAGPLPGGAATSDPAQAALLILALLDGLGLPLALYDPAIGYEKARAAALAGIGAILGLPPGYL
jgi:AcrR family transcriptional regulator